ncbi:hypothetical protein LTR09_002978 [Extremus antarcticus]|uniref:Uncharacterized protein n=1 Tax=Extremus antarcticus TaxID=702011 RepID=A0AAJ0GFE6_9PEZI|nr:hypothetical protein LTR09_002978 [Extremus antarcticus]
MVAIRATSPIRTARYQFCQSDATRCCSEYWSFRRRVPANADGKRRQTLGASNQLTTAEDSEADEDSDPQLGVRSKNAIRKANERKRLRADAAAGTQTAKDEMERRRQYDRKYQERKRVSLAAVAGSSAGPSPLSLLSMVGRLPAPSVYVQPTQPVNDSSSQGSLQLPVPTNIYQWDPRGPILLYSSPRMLCGK